MEPATTSSSLYGDRDEERGVGGKLKRPSGRNPPATPYSRPAANSYNSRSTGGWWSKLVDPAKRLVSGGATMLLPSFFPQSAAAAALPTAECQDKLDGEVLPNADKDGSQSLSHFVPKLSGLAGPSEILSDKSETNRSSKGHGETSNNFKDDSEICRIEQLIEGKSLSRDEVNRLMEILTSKVEGEERKKVTTTSGRAEGVLWTPSSMIPDERNQRDVDKDILRTPVPLLQPNVHNAVGASPVDIAKAYMGGRNLECDPSPRSALSKGETTAHQTDEVVINPLMASTSIESSTCWPGAVVQDPCNYTTPRQRTRYGLHDFPRTTPYSRTIRSKSRDKLHSDSRLLRTSPNPYQQSRTPIFGQDKLRNPILADDSYGSVGPIRRIGNKFASETRPRGSNFPNSKVFQQRNVSDGIIPPPEEVPEKSAGTSFTETAAHVNPYPSQAVKRILEQLDRKKPTPKEMADELKLAASWRNTPGVTSNATRKDKFSFPHAGELQPPLKTDIVGPVFTTSQDSKQNGENTYSQIQSHGKSIASTSDVLTSAKPRGIVIRDSETGYAVDPPSYSFGPSNNKSSSQISSFAEVQATSTDTRLAEASSNLPSFSRSNGQHVTSTSVPNQSKFEQANKPPQHPYGSKPNLAYISVSRQDLISRGSENGAGFTFPISTSSSALSEPPTPSIMPFSSNNSLPPPSHSKEEPSYSFGTKSAARLVFSFPSTSSSSQDDASDLKFDFGTDKKTRLSFGSVGKDAICY